MKIYYSYSLWDKGEGLCGVSQRVNWQFKHAEETHHIPVLYRFSKGIVFDVITVLNEEKVKAFFEKYKGTEETLTPLQTRCVEQEHPYQAISIKEIWIDEKKVESSYFSSSAVYIPWAMKNNQMKPLRKAYASILKDITCFACKRFCVPYPETDSKFQELLRFFRLNRIKNVKLFTGPVEYFFPLDIRFEMSDQENQKEICFAHPKTGIKHRLYFQNPQSVKMPMDRDQDRWFYVIQSMYEINPALPQGDSLQFSSSIQYTEPPKDRFSPIASSAIGVIGGACGPTAFFSPSKNKEKAVPQGLHGLSLHSCFSVPGLNKEDAKNFVLEGISIKNYDRKEYIFQ